MVTVRIGFKVRTVRVKYFLKAIISGCFQEGMSLRDIPQQLFFVCGKCWSIYVLGKTFHKMSTFESHLNFYPPILEFGTVSIIIFGCKQVWENMTVSLNKSKLYGE